MKFVAVLVLGIAAVVGSVLAFIVCQSNVALEDKSGVVSYAILLILICLALIASILDWRIA